MDVDAYLAPSCKHVVQKFSSRTSTSVHAHGRHHHLHNVHDLLHARYVKGRRAKGKKKKAQPVNCCKKEKEKEHSIALYMPSEFTIPTAVDIFFLCMQTQAFN
jgi:hypothetical protein